LRVGFVSADFGVHPVGWFLLGLFSAFDPSRMELACYSARRVQDWMTTKLKAAAALWRPIIGLNDETLARQVRADGVDVLVDLSGHTAGNRLGVFALKPAPIQVSWLGYIHTTGLAQMDGILMDEASVPAGEERLFVERVLRLSGGRFCYTAPDYAPAVRPPPALEKGFVTFGSFNNLTKATPEVIETWSRVLKGVPGSRLILKWKTFADQAERARFIEVFGDLGIDAGRLDLRGVSEHAAMLGEYGDIDIGLDPFPFSGGLTSCEALWMGLPIVTFPGTRPVSRQTLGFLRALGREEWVASDADDYVAKAVALARAPTVLADIRAAQRARMAASPLCDAKAHAAAFEAAIRGLWRNWCATPSA
jgi:predicted O-linked N-acetylglucosamine transferase (SPINDLY family)